MDCGDLMLKELIKPEREERMKIQKYDAVLDDSGKNVLVEEFSEEYTDIDNLDSPEKIVEVMEEVFGLSDKAKEYMYLICMNAGCMPVGFFEVAHGTCHAAVVGMREIFVRTLLCGASDIVVVHNHPGGDGADTGGGGTAGSPVLRPYHYSAGRLFQLFGGEEDGQEKGWMPLKIIYCCIG